MPNEYSVKLYRIDGEQAVDIPPELELPGDEVVMYREGERLVIVPKDQYRPPTGLLASKEPAEEEIQESPDIPRKS